MEPIDQISEQEPVTPEDIARAHDIRLERYKNLHTKELDWYKAQTDLERYAIVAIAGTYAWLFSRAGLPPISKYLACVPIIISFVVLIRFRAYIAVGNRVRREAAAIERHYVKVVPEIVVEDHQYTFSNSQLRSIINFAKRHNLSGTWSTIFVISVIVGIVEMISPVVPLAEEAGRTLK